MAAFTREELSMLARHCDLVARHTRYELRQLNQRIADQHPLRATLRQKTRKEKLEKELALYEGARDKLDERLVALGPLPGLRTGE